MIGNLAGNLIDFTSPVATSGGLSESQRGTWLVRQGPAPAPAVSWAWLLALTSLLLGCGAAAASKTSNRI